MTIIRTPRSPQPYDGKTWLKTWGREPITIEAGKRDFSTHIEAARLAVTARNNEGYQPRQRVLATALGARVLRDTCSVDEIIPESGYALVSPGLLEPMWTSQADLIIKVGS